MWNTEKVLNPNLLQPSFFQHFTTQLLLTFYNPTASNPLQRSWFDLLQPNFFQPFTTYLLLVFYNPSVSNLLQPTCFQHFTTQFASNLLQLNSFQPFTIQLFLIFYNPAASNFYKIVSKGVYIEPLINMLQHPIDSFSSFGEYNGQFKESWSQIANYQHLYRFALGMLLHIF